MQDFSAILQSADSHVDVKDDSILVAQQGEQDAATATIMATVEQQESKYLKCFIFVTRSCHLWRICIVAFGFCSKIFKFIN